MYIARRRFLRAAAGALALPALAHSVRADAYPSRPVHIIVGFPPGGPTDVGARLIGQWLSQRLGQPFIIENRPGAANNIATEAAAHAPADGYTLLAAVGSNTINPALYSNLSFNFIRDMRMVAGIYRSPLVLEVIPALPVHSVPELIAYAKANPGKVTLASFGTGTVSHIAGEFFRMNAGGLDMVHVPYRGSAPMVVDLLAGQVQAAFDNLPASMGYIEQGKLRALAVTTPERWPALPGIPALSEFQPGFDASAWIGIAAPTGTPAEIIDKLAKEINAGLGDAKVQAQIAALGAVPFVMSSADLDKMVAEDTDRWGKVIRTAGIKIE
jgi:tripartite-type tricarboxylate transporter receptor subunit TctC